MPVNPDAVGEKGSPTKRAWNSKDALLYALGVGAGVDELADRKSTRLNSSH
jgi:hypothetical protein